MRISATTLEAYRLYLESDWMSFDKLAVQLRGEQETTPQMTRGTSLHEILEAPQVERQDKFGCIHLRHDPQTGEDEAIPCYQHLGHMWESQSVDAIRSSGGINEIKVEYPIDTSRGQAVLVAKADKVQGFEVIDYKTTGSAFSAEKYLNSVQWKIYCLAFGALTFTYRVFEIREKEGEPHVIKAVHSLPCFPYYDMDKDVQRLTEDFIEFCHQHGFMRARWGCNRTPNPLSKRNRQRHKL